MATLMSLTRRGCLSIINDSDGEGVALQINTACELSESDVADGDACALDLLKTVAGFCADAAEPKITLQDAKAASTANKTELDKIYGNWKQTVKAAANNSIAANKNTLRLLDCVKYLGYVSIVMAALSIYLFASNLIYTTSFLVVGAILVAISFVLQNKMLVERRHVRELHKWLTSLGTYLGELPEDLPTIKRLMEYAWVFGIEQEVVKALLDTGIEPQIREMLPELRFWKALRAELYSSEQ
jgi:hypothetical protein